MKALIIFVLVITAVVLAYYHYRAELHPYKPGVVAYVLPALLEVVDTPAEVRRSIATLHAGDQIRVLAKTENWAEIRLADGRAGWIPLQGVLDADTFEKDQALFNKLRASQAQASGHANSDANLHLEPSRTAALVAELSENERVEVYGRQIVEREPNPASSGKGVTDVWYQVATARRAGWLLGRLVDLDIPPGIAMYAQGINLVAWLVLDTVNDGGREMQQYLAADRIGTRDLDFNHIRVFTYWIKRHKYVTAYVESNLEGYFPLQVTHLGGVPYFRLRLTDPDGHKIQKVYGLFDTIVRPIGTIDGWESQAMPSSPGVGPKRRRGQTRKPRVRKSALLDRRGNSSEGFGRDPSPVPA